MADSHRTRSSVCEICKASFDYPGGIGRRRRYCFKAECFVEKQHRTYIRQYKPVEPANRKRNVSGRKTFTKACELCGIEFTAIRRDRKLCSKQCGNRFSAIRLNEGKPARPDRRCKHCGKTFKPKSPSNITFCSRDCCFAYERIHGRDWQSGWKERRDAEAARLVRTRDCTSCGQAFVQGATTRGYCSDKCRKENNCKKAAERVQRTYNSNRTERHCTECGQAFMPEYGDKKRNFCSKKCSRRNGHRAAAGSRRARERAVAYERINPIEICERDGWRCHLCHRSTPRRLRGTCNDRAPEIDHIVPLAAGGTHTRNNLACCCRGCNFKKGAVPMGQMRLVLDTSVA